MRRGLFFCVLSVLGEFVAGCAAPPASDGVLRVAVPREPSTWNRLLAAELVTHIVTDQLHAPLIRLNQKTQQMEPALAASWEFSGDGTKLVFHLRDGVRFSDGEPFTAEDVAFTFRALHDPGFQSPLMDSARVDGRPLIPEVIDERTVCFELPRRTAAVERIFDSIRILPEHRLAESLERGTLAADTGLGAPVESVVGLGPFRLRAHVPGQRIVLEKNPFYFGARQGGGPHLSGLVFEIVPDASAQVLRLSAGEVDVIEPMAPELFRELRELGSDELVVTDLGPGMVSERLWFNLNPDSPIDPAKKQWFGDVRFRRAVSLTIDREAMARVVFGGLATPAAGPVSPANDFWRDETIVPTGRDVGRARRLLADAGFRWKKGKLHDRDDIPVRFTIVTAAGNDVRRRAGAFLQEDLAKLGIDVSLVPLEGGALLAAITGTFEYDACLLGFSSTDPDPSAEMGLWMSSAPLHLWHPRQSEPATEWEAEIDRLMERQMLAVDPERRKACYHEVQRIVAEKLPVIDLVVPHALAAHRRRLRGVRLTPFTHLLWNSEELFLEGGSAGLDRGATWGNEHPRHIVTHVTEPNGARE